MPRHTRRLSLLMPVLMLAGSLVGASSAAARAQGGGACEIALATGSPVQAGQSADLVGHLVCAEEADLAGQTVTVYEHQRGQGRAKTEVASATTEPDGSFTLQSEPLSVRTVFFARSAGSRRARLVVPIAADAITLLAPEATTAAVSSGARAHQRRDRYTISGSVAGAPAGTRVALQSDYPSAGGDWRTIAFTRVQEGGDFSFEHGFRMPGAVELRVRVRPAGQQASFSEALTLQVAQSQSAGLAIEATVDPLSAGGQTIIRGQSAAVAGQTVTLMARNHGGTWVAIADDEAGADGSYAFPVSPTVSTSYRVTAGKLRSRALFEGVHFALTQAVAPLTPASDSPLLTGTVLPAVPGQSVRLEQQLPGGSFHVIATAAVEASGEYSLPEPANLPEGAVLRLRVPGDGQDLEATALLG